VKVRAWDEALSWQETVKFYAAEHSSSPLHKAFNTGYDTHYLRLLFCIMYFCNPNVIAEAKDWVLILY